MWQQFSLVDVNFDANFACCSDDRCHDDHTCNPDNRIFRFSVSGLHRLELETQRPSLD